MYVCMLVLLYVLMSLGSVFGAFTMMSICAVLEKKVLILTKKTYKKDISSNQPGKMSTIK